MGHILPWLDKLGYRVIRAAGESALAREIQLYAGDLLALPPSGAEWRVVEVKAERENKWGNLFLEWWSNRSIGRAGWFRTCRAGVLLYYFLATDEMYVVDLPALRHWANYDRLSNNYQLKFQTQTEQANDTWGYCVPIGHILMALGPKRARRWHIRANRDRAA